MKALKGISLAVGIAIWFYGMLFFGFLFSGVAPDGGDPFLAKLVLAPFGSVLGEAAADRTIFSWLVMGLWPLVGVLVALRHFVVCRMLAAAILVVHYWGIVTLTWDIEWRDVAKVWGLWPAVIIMFLMVYLGSQISLWFLIFWRRRPGLNPSGAGNGGITPGLDSGQFGPAVPDQNR